MAANAASTPQKHPAPKVAFSMLMAIEMRGEASGWQFLQGEERDPLEDIILTSRATRLIYKTGKPLRVRETAVLLPGTTWQVSPFAS